jgi:hypothetical protein
MTRVTFFPDRGGRQCGNAALHASDDIFLIFATAVLLSLSLLSVSYSRTFTVAKSGGDFPSVQTGLTAANAGDTVLVKSSVFNEAVSFGKSGNLSGYITLIGERGAILDGTSRGQKGITISDKSYIKVIGMEVQNFTGSGTPIGISVEGSSSNLEIRNNRVHTIENANGNAHGIALYGTSSTPMTAIFIDANEICNCKLGQSESMVLNGNVTNFTVSNNYVHDNDNIGIDFIGFEGTGPADQDQVRNGICFGNHVDNISSATNPTYGGERSADGIYVDGGKDIVIEQNFVDSCDIGIEIASEHGGMATSGITVRSNFVSRSYQGNVMCGGYAADRGNASGIVIVNNTLYRGGDGEIVLQYNCSGISIKNNICYANSGTEYISNSGSNNSSITLDNNLYFGASTSSPGSWSDAHAKYGDPLLINAPADMHVQPASPVRNAGTALSTDIAGTKDIDGQPRVYESVIDIGADEIINNVIMHSVKERPYGNQMFLIHSLKGSRKILITSDIPLGRLAIFGMNGRLVKDISPENTPGTISLDNAGFSNGRYVARAITDRGTETAILEISK